MWVVAVMPWLTWRKTIPYDAKDEFYPGVVFTVGSLLRGEAPFWNPYLFSGYPSFADPQAMTFSPTVVLPMLVSQDFVWFDIVVLLHLLFAGFGMLRLGRSYGWPHFAALIAAMVFMFGGVASSRLQHTPMIVTWTFLPWIFVALRELLRQRSWLAAAGLGLALGLGALQLTQVTYLALLLVGACAIGGLWKTAFSEGRRGAAAIAVRLGAAGALSLLIVSPQLVATMGILPYSTRATIAFSDAAANSLAPVAYATLVSPNALGSLWGTYVGPNDLTETYFYLGAFPAAMLLSGLGRRRQGLGPDATLFWTLALAVSVVYALGDATPAFAWLFDYVPGVQRFRRPTDAAFLSVFCAAVLIGASMNPLRERTEAGAGPTARLRVIGVTVVLLLVGALGATAWSGTTVSPLSLAMLVFGYLCLARARRAEQPGAWLAVLVLSVFVDLKFHNVGNRLNAHRAEQYLASTSTDGNPAIRFVARRLRERPYDRIELRTGVGEANLPEVAGLFSIGGLNPLVLKDYVDFTGMDSNPHTPRRATGAFDTYRGKVNDLLGVRYLIADDSMRHAIARDLGPSYQPVAELEGRVIWENSRALPRVLRPRQPIPGPPPALYMPAMLNGIDLEEYVHVEAPMEVLAKCGGDRATLAGITRYSNNAVVLEVQTSTAAWVVLNDIYLDGWRAEIAGESIPVYRANGLFRAVCVPPGHHSVQFVFAPYRRWLERVVEAFAS